MSNLPRPLPDPSQPQPQDESIAERPEPLAGPAESPPEPGPSPEPLPVGSHQAPEAESPDVQTPEARIALAAAEGLSDSQRAVMGYLAAGNSIAKSARLGNVNRRTVHRWFNEDADFRAAYNAWRRELAASARTRALAMSDDALDTIHNAILAGDAKASLTLVNSLGLLEKQRIGPDDPQRISHKRRVRQMRRAVADDKALRDAREALPYRHPLRYTDEERAQMEKNDRRRREEHEREQRENQPEWRNRWRQATRHQAPADEATKSPPPDSPRPAEPEADPRKRPDAPQE